MHGARIQCIWISSEGEFHSSKRGFVSCAMIYLSPVLCNHQAGKHTSTRSRRHNISFATFFVSPLWSTASENDILSQRHTIPVPWGEEGKKSF